MQSHLFIGNVHDFWALFDELLKVFQVAKRGAFPDALRVVVSHHDFACSRC
jgi:hypothetical protein